MTDQVLQELSKQTINITKFEEATLTWHESYLTVLTEKGVHFFEFSHNVQCLDKRIDCIQSFIGHPKSSPASCLFTERVLNKDTRNIDLTEMIVDQALWPHNSQLLQEMSTIVDFKWSPVGAVNNHGSAIAVMTNVGVVEIYIQHLYKWKCALQISALLTKECMENVNKPRTFNTLKDMAYMLATTAVCWSPVLNQDNSCYFITAQKNGNIILWLIECKESSATAKMIDTLQSGSCEIVSMLWIWLTDEKFLLVCTTILGQIIVLDFRIQNNAFELLQSHTIWAHKDRMITKYLEHIEIDNKIVLICNKHRHLLVLMIDKECKVLGHYTNNINDYRITCISKTGNDIHLTTVNCKIYQLDLTMNKKDLDMSLNLIEHQGLSSTHELYSIGYSPNKIICAITAVDRKVNCRKSPMKVEIILMSTKEKLNSLLDMILLNPTKQLTTLWDAIEVLRYKTLKTKEAPAVDYNQLYEMACSDIYMLKVYLILSTLCGMLKKLYKLGVEFQLPEESIDIVKEEILVAYADKLIHQYYNKFQLEGNLDEIEKECFLGAKKFLQYFFEKNKKNIFEIMDPKILNILDSSSPYECQCCDELVSGFRCRNEHLNMFCALTFTPIDSDRYLICKWCNLTARVELMLENPLCLFCDVPLRFVDE